VGVYLIIQALLRCELKETGELKPKFLAVISGCIPNNTGVI
jgi:hypothetical protein